MASPTDITGLVHRFRASQLTGISNGGSVSSATFEMGGSTMTQATAANQPTYATTSINGVAGLRFNGTTTYMNGTVSSNMSQPFTLSVVVKLNDAASKQEIINAQTEIILNDVAANSYALYSGGTEIYGGTPTVGAHVITVVGNGNASKIYVDGTQVATGPAGTANYGAFTIGSVPGGGARYFNGDVCEINVYNRALTDVERATYGRYIQDTYAITVADAAATTVSSSRFVRSSDLVAIVMANAKAPAISTNTSNYVLAIRDAGTVVEMNMTANNTVTVPPNSTVAFPVGTILTVTQVGIGQTNVIGGAGVVFDAPKGTAVYARYGSVQLRQRAVNEWVISGAATDFIDPTTVSGLVYRLRASMLGITTNGANVASATPEVGTTVLSQPTAAAQPKWYAAGKNGKPYLSFDGVDDYLFNSTSVGYSQPFTIAVAAQPYLMNGPKELVKIGGLELILNTATSLGPRWALYSGSSVDNIYQAGGVESFVAMFGSGGTGNGVGYTNGVLTSATNTGNNVTNGDLYVGTHTSVARFYSGDIYEILMYNAALTNADLLKISAYFRAFYQ